MTRFVHHEHLGAYRFAPEGTTCRVLVVGEDNPQSADPRHALYPHPPGCAGQRLSDILGLSMSEHLSLWRTNLCNPRWSILNARRRRDLLLGPAVPWSVLVLLGRKVAGVFEEKLGELPAFSNFHAGPTSDGGVENRSFAGLVLPHPSGRNLVWNNRENWRLARQMVRTVTSQDVHDDIPFGLPEEVED